MCSSYITSKSPYKLHNPSFIPTGAWTSCLHEQMVVVICAYSGSSLVCCCGMCRNRVTDGTDNATKPADATAAINIHQCVGACAEPLLPIGCLPFSSPQVLCPLDLNF